MLFRFSQMKFTQVLGDNTSVGDRFHFQKHTSSDFSTPKVLTHVYNMIQKYHKNVLHLCFPFISSFSLCILFAREGGANIDCCRQEGIKPRFIDWKCLSTLKFHKFLWLLLYWHYTLIPPSQLCYRASSTRTAVQTHAFVSLLVRTRKSD